jgi:hypothetical protein
MSDFVLPTTRYAITGDLNINQTMGEGPLDIVVVPGGISHFELPREMAGIGCLLFGVLSTEKCVGSTCTPRTLADMLPRD